MRKGIIFIFWAIILSIAANYALSLYRANKIEIYLAQAKEEASNGNFDKAIVLGQKAKAIDSDDPQLSLYINSLIKDKKVDDYLKCISTILKNESKINKEWLDLQQIILRNKSSKNTIKQKLDNITKDLEVITLRSEQLSLNLDNELRHTNEQLVESYNFLNLANKLKIYSLSNRDQVVQNINIDRFIIESRASKRRFLGTVHYKAREIGIKLGPEFQLK